MMKRKPSFSSERSERVKLYGGAGKLRRPTDVDFSNFPNIQGTGGNNIIGSQHVQRSNAQNRGGGGLSAKSHLYNFSDSK